MYVIYGIQDSTFLVLSLALLQIAVWARQKFKSNSSRAKTEWLTKLFFFFERRFSLEATTGKLMI